MGVGKVRLGILYLFPITIGSADVGRYASDRESSADEGGEKLCGGECSYRSPIYQKGATRRKYIGAYDL